MIVPTRHMVVLVAGIICLGNALCVEAQTSAPDSLREVTLQLKWKHQFQFAGYYAAIKNGYYAEAGLKVQLVEAKTGEDPAYEVFRGNADFGIAGSDVLIMRSEGYNPIILGAIFQHSAMVLLTSQASGITYIQDLQGKRIALESHAADIISYMNDEGVSLDDVDIDNHSFDTSLLLNGEVDAITAYISDEPFSLRQAGFAFNIINPAMGGIDFYGDVLFTSKSLMERDPESVEKFRRASLKGWNYAMDNPEEIVNLIYEEYTQRHTKDHLRYEAEQMQRLIMPNIIEIGYSNQGRWQRILDIYSELDMLDSEESLSGLFYEEYNTNNFQIPWHILLFAGVAFGLIGSATVFYYRLSKKLEEREKELEAANASKDKFLSIIAHDLRNPFSAVVGITDLLILDAKEDNNEHLHQNLSLIRETSLRTSGLLDNLLLWSRTQTGSIDFNPQMVEAETVIKNTIKLLEGRASQKKIILSWKTNGVGLVWADPNMFNNIVQNLVANAIKFTSQEGSVEIGLIKEKEGVKAYVKDDGVGITPENQQRLFELENKHTSKGTDDEKGSGLGLLLCKEFVDCHGGEIWVESELGKGSIFWFSLPNKSST